MNQNPRWIAEKHDTIAFVEERAGMPVNPPFVPGSDTEVEEVSIMNWNGDDGLEFRPRVRERNDWIDGGRAPGLEKGMRAAADDDAPELDWEYDCD